MAAGIELVGLTKRFHHGHAAAVDNIDLSVASGEFFSLLGRLAVVRPRGPDRS